MSTPSPSSHDALQEPTTFASWIASAIDVGSSDARLSAHELNPGCEPTLTFLHGYPSSSLDVVPVARLLPDTRVVTLDLPGFGASSKPPDGPYSIDRAADAVEAMWRAFGVTRTTLLAHDYSVSVAQELLARGAGDERVEIVGVVWCNGGLYPELHRPTVGQQMLLDPEHGESVAHAMDGELFARGVAVTWGTRRPFDVEAIGEMWESMVHDGGSRIAHRLLHYIADRRANRERWVSALESSAIPMRFVWGELDPVSGGHVADRLVERFAPGTVVRLMDVGHWPPLEAPDAVAAACQALL